MGSDAEVIRTQTTAGNTSSTLTPPPAETYRAAATMYKPQIAILNQSPRAGSQTHWLPATSPAENAQTEAAAPDDVVAKHSFCSTLEMPGDDASLGPNILAGPAVDSGPLRFDGAIWMAR